MPVAPLKYTGVRKQEYDDLFKPLRLRGEARDAYIRELNTSERRAVREANKRRAVREAKEVERLRLARIEEAKKEAEREARRKQKQAEYNAKRKEKRTQSKRNAYFAEFTNKLTNGERVLFNRKNMVKHNITFNEILNYLVKNINIKLIININNVHYVLNDKTRIRLTNLIKNDLTFSQTSQESDGAITYEIGQVPFFTVEPFTPTNRNKLVAGAFFKYTNNTDFDFSRFGVFKSINPENYIDTCLIHAFKQFGIDNEKIEKVKFVVKNRTIPKSDLNKIADIIETRINLKTGDSNNDSRYNVFGKQYENQINIGVLDEHYFLLSEVSITSFALKNYFDINKLNNFHQIYKKSGKYYERDSKRNIDSFTALKILLENKDTHLKQITLEDTMIASTQFYDRVDVQITNLNYNQDSCIRPIVPDEKKESKKTYKNVFFDFETDPNGLHKPYLCRTFDGETHREFLGEKCGLYMLCSLDSDTRLIAHNCTYDYRFIVQYLSQIQEIAKGNRLMSARGYFKKHEVIIKDSYHLMSMPLSKFSKTFKLGDVEKEVMPYTLYTQENIDRRFVPIQEALTYIAEKDKTQFLNNITRWNLQQDDSYDIIKYSSEYCKIDCEILAKGYNVFRGWILQIFSLDINDILTCASLAHKYFVNEQCYKGVNELGGVPQMFIQKCVVGGRVMCSENKKNYIESYIGNDFDATSLYPSAMSRLQGFLKGIPKVITNNNYDWIKQQDGYFVEIVIDDVKIKRQFPIMSYVKETGVRDFTNDMVGKTMFVDKTTLEDLIIFHGISFTVTRGYYFDEGFNTEINRVINYVFEERLKAKAEGNPIELVYKLIMNSGYGKSIMKPIESESVFFDVYKSDHDFKVFLSRNYNWITSFIRFGDKIKVNLMKTLIEHFNIAQVGVSILSMSKRIMNEVMCSAEDSGIDIYYQDTDSMHLKDSDIKKLSDVFRCKYGRELIGKKMGQFHSDFELEGCKNIVCSKSIFLGKKCYIDELQGINKNGEKETGYHIRMKGIPEKVIDYTYKKLNYKNPFDMYVDLYKGKSIEFDLTNDGTKANFKFNKNYTIETVVDFKRTIKFQ